MSASGERTKRIRPERRIIERPRLIKLLDESDVRIILLVAPAGYGKTTLARQWVKTLNGAIWVAATPAHRDVVTFSEDIAAGVDALGGNASRFIGEYMRARSNPQRAPREIAGALAQRVEDAGVQWLILDDYHELAESVEIEEMIEVLRARTSARMLVASRIRPKWATTRRSVYGELVEIGPSDLAMTADESTAMLGRRPELEGVVDQAQGWPAVLALAAGLGRTIPPVKAMPAKLHRYIAEELFQSAPLELRNALVSLALLPDLDRRALEERFGPDAGDLVSHARDLGFLAGDDAVELHPLLREFLLLKLSEASDAEDRVHQAVEASLDREAWDNALDLVLRFDLIDMVDVVLERAFKPLVRQGRLGTASAFAARVRQTPGFPPPTVDVVEAEVALRDGEFSLAIELAERAQRHLPEAHVLKSQANAIVGHSNFQLSSFREAEEAFERARRTSQDKADEAESLHGLATSRIYGEHGDPSEALAALATLRHDSPRHLLRFATADLARRHFSEGLRGPLHLEEPLHAFEQVEDPRVRTAFAYVATHSLAQRSEYRRALDYLRLLFDDVQAFGLEFALPFANWTSALISLGLRHFGESDRLLQRVEEAVEQGQAESHALNAQILRARLLLQTGKQSEALEHLSAEQGFPVLPSWRAERLATRALVLACLGEADPASREASEARAVSRCIQVTALAASAEAVISAQAGDAGRGLELMSLAEQLGIWDPVICALRASPDLSGVLSVEPSVQPQLQRLYERSNDFALARRAGFRVRSLRSPTDVLSPRELEVMGLVARGLRNHEIAAALFIAESTAKVHVRHVLEKLGVRTRAEAVARFERLQTS